MHLFNVVLLNTHSACMGYFHQLKASEIDKSYNLLHTLFEIGILKYPVCLHGYMAQTLWSFALNIYVAWMETRGKISILSGQISTGCTVQYLVFV